MKNLLAFTEFLQKFRRVKRRIKFRDGSFENDAEHSFQLAMTAWYIVSTNKLKLDLEKIFAYSLAHDLVETYAGDTPSEVHRTFSKSRKTKEDREDKALKRIEKEFSSFKSLHKIIKAYERRADEESKLVYALDKIMPILNIYLEKGYSWKIYKVSIDDVIEYKKDKIAESKAIKKYFDLMIPKIKKLKGF